jgi:hypothetical protein
MKKWFSDNYRAKYESGHPGGYYTTGGRKSVLTRQIIQWVILLLVLFTLYMIFFNPNLSPDVLSVVKPIIYIGEVIIFFGSLFLINRINLGESDLGIWGMRLLAVVIIFFGVLFFFFSGFIVHYTGPVALFGVILIFIGAFMAFRARRRYGQFVYLR